MNRTTLTLALMLACFVFDEACGGTTTKAMTDPDGSIADSCTLAHRSHADGTPENRSCGSSPDSYYFRDAGMPACSDSSECASRRHCLNGMCSVDECMRNDDCTEGTACVCGNDLHGAVTKLNVCRESGCRGNADCESGVCSGSFGGNCGSLDGYFCHSPKDTCDSDADCCGSTPACLYRPELGHWACVARMKCSG